MESLLNQYFSSLSVLEHKRVQAKMAFVWAIIEVVLGIIMIAVGIGLYLLFKVEQENLANLCVGLVSSFGFLLLLKGTIGTHYELNTD